MARESSFAMETITKIQSKIERVLAFWAGAIIFVMMFPVGADVFLRYVFNRPLQGSYQLGEFLVVGCAFLAIAYIQRLKGHVNVQVATSRLPKGAQIRLGILGYVVGLVILSIMTWQSGIAAWEAWVTHDYTMGIVEFPLWPAKSVVPLGCGLLCVRLTLDIVTDILGLKKEE